MTARPPTPDAPPAAPARSAPPARQNVAATAAPPFCAANLRKGYFPPLNIVLDKRIVEPSRLPCHMKKKLRNHRDTNLFLQPVKKVQD